MFAQPYPREFLCCICHAKKPHQQLHAAHCPGGFLVRLLHTVPFLPKAICKSDVSACVLDTSRDSPQGCRGILPGEGWAGSLLGGCARTLPP